LFCNGTFSPFSISSTMSLQSVAPLLATSQQT
jgi:hypothetical protein